ncbi:hypothetical protein I5M32_06805 [Pedobacter sp. SD-b]|uniref:Outer membrane protein beta-barrel family protein n=1 Tax=Pedobacter segetis TaxID=2793069 RepID=A0ABS1BIF4_9SPHI|nr:hypothetical protein [Pedobacter segetis]MBK0382668.1 hypothetical protein [Pedobacter segetis]
MKIRFYLLKPVILFFFFLGFNSSYGQTVDQKSGYVFVGLDINVATLSSATSIKTLMGVNFGYNKKIANHLYAGPQINAVFIKSPVNKGARLSLFAGPSTEMEIKRIGKNPLTASQSLSNRLSWVFPLNPKSSDFTYTDCFSVSTSLSNDEFFGFNKTSVDIGIDFQGYDIGFYNGLSRMISISSGTRTSF